MNCAKNVLRIASKIFLEINQFNFLYVRLFQSISTNKLTKRVSEYTQVSLADRQRQECFGILYLGAGVDLIFFPLLSKLTFSWQAIALGAHFSPVL